MLRTRTTTVVFTDLVGSTELAVRRGHGAYEEMRRAHFEALRLSASVHQGIEIKSTGDGLVFAFASAAEAVACMIRMQQSVTRAASSGGKLKVRIGASCGETNREGNDIFGFAVVEAARLCAAALPSQILVADIIPNLTRGLDFKFGPVSEFALKGLPRISACTVDWMPLDAAHDIIPLPPKISPVPSLGVYGRGKELAIIKESLAAATRGQRQVVLLAGEPGIGKTRLSTEAGRTGYGEGATVLLGTCDEDIRPPYRPFAEALRHLVAHAPDEILLQNIREHQGDLLRIVPALAERVPDVPKPHTADAETERYLMFEAVAGLLSNASQQRPVILILDDLQWAGTPELLLLKHIVRSRVPMRLLILGTYRDTELTQKHPLSDLLADLRREAGVERIGMAGLDEDGVVEFVTAMVGHDLDDAQRAMARAISRETEGSPLFVGELLRHFAETNGIFWHAQRIAAGAEISGLGIPEGVREAIEQRLSRFSVDTNKILTTASVIGREFDLALLNQVTEVSESVILDAIDEATSAALIAETTEDSNGYAFTHVLVRTSLYDALNPDRRARLHARVGTALEKLLPGKRQRIDELARHWLAAGRAGDPMKAIAYARQAGDQSLASLAFEQAAKYYEHALSMLADYGEDSETLRCDLLVALADAQRRAGDSTYRQTVDQAVKIARSLCDPKRFAMAALCSARPDHPFASANVIDQPLIRLYEEAIASLENEDENILLAKLFAYLAGELLYTPHRERREELARKAVAIARECGDPAVLVLALHIYASAINDPTTLKQRLALTAEQVELADKLGSFEMRWTAAYQRMGALLESGDLKQATQMLAVMKQVSPKLRQPFFNWATAHAFAMISVMSGQADAEQEVTAAFELGTAGGQPDAKQAYLSQLSVIRRDQGRHGELIEPLRGFVEALPHLPVWRIVLAGLFCETDQLEEARSQMGQLAALDFKVSLDWTWASSVFSLSQVCADLGDQKFAALYYPQLQPVADQVGVTGIGLVCYGSLALPCGQFATCLRRWTDAERHFDQALEMNAYLGARPYLVRTLRAYASMLLDRNAPGDRVRAAKLIEKGLAEAHNMGMGREIVRLDRLRARMDSNATPSISAITQQSAMPRAPARR